MSDGTRDAAIGDPIARLPRAWFDEVERGLEFVTLMDSRDRVLYVNRAVPTVGEYAGESVYSFVDVDYHDVLRTAVASARGTGLPQHFTSRAAGLDGESSLNSNWVIALSGVDLDGMVAFVAADMTEQGRIEAELELTEVTLRSLVQNSPDSIVIVDSDRRILFVNRVEHGHEMAEVLGEPAEAFVPEGDRQLVVDAVERVLQTGEPFSYTSGFSAPDGDRRFATRAVPIPGAGGINRVMLVATDITAQIAADREKELLEAALHQAQKMEALGQLTGGVAHDFNNILVAISGNLELAQMFDGDADERTSRIAAALEAVRHATILTERLLAFSRKQTLRPRPIDVGSLVGGMQELLVRTLGENVRVSVESAHRLRPCRVDPAQLESAVLNLAVNARDAMPRGGDLRIRTNNATVTREDDASVPPGEYVVLEVEDEGTGMTPEVAAQAFEPFFTSKEAGLGTGLGLSMVYGFVLQSGGHVRLRTEPDGGTTVKIYFEPSLGVAGPPRSPNVADDAVRGNREVILLVEDNEMVRTVTAGLLDHLGYRTIAVERADAALAQLGSDSDIDLMITDLVLPGDIDGAALAERARMIRPVLRVLLVSGYPQEVLSARGGDGPNADLLMKPYTLRQLADAVNLQLARAGSGAGVDHRE